MNAEIHKVKAMIDPGIYAKVDKASDLFQRACDAQKMMDATTDAIRRWRKRKPGGRWDIRVSIDGENLNITHENPFADLTGEVVYQLVQLLDAIYHTELKEAVEEFNKSLEESKDGSYTNK